MCLAADHQRRIIQEAQKKIVKYVFGEPEKLVI